MPEFNGSRSVLSADANYQATDWAGARGGAQLDLRATAELKRGIDLELGASALVSLDASISKFLVADVSGQANAAARVRAQIQVPLDLFNEIGVAIRLQAVAEAAAGIELGIGLNVGDFLALAGDDPRMKGVALRLLRILLEEAEIKGGVLAKAAAAAMAYANVSITGKLVGDTPGFMVAAEAGVGLKAGAGFRVFGGFGLAQPQRLIRKTVDAVVDETLTRIAEGTTDAIVLRALDELRAPAKMALRTAFEVGAELARSGNFNPANGPVVVQRCVQVMFEEAQRYLLDKLANLGLGLFKEALANLGFARNAWDAAQAQREALAARLSAVPEDPFEPNDENKAYWADVFARATDLAVALGAQNSHTAPWIDGMSLLWAATQLAFRAASRISDSAARATMIGAAVDTQFPPFAASPIESAPPKIAEHINAKLRPGSPPQSLTERDLVAFLLDKAFLDALVARVPSVRAVIEVIGGPGAAHVAAITTIFENLGAFVPAAGGRVDPSASLGVIVDGLAAYVNTRLQSEVEPAIRAALADLDPELSLYFDEVLLDTLGFTMNTVHARALSWASGDQAGHTALREACSAVVMRVFGRSLVVSVDVLMAKAMAEVSNGFRAAVPELNRGGGVIDHLAGVVPIDRATLRDVVTEIFDIASDVFTPLPVERRARLRELMYQVIDTAPAGGSAALADSLRNDMLIPNAEAATELALELGVLIRDNFVRLVTRILELILGAILQLIEDTLRAIEAQITQWIADLQAFLGDVVRLIADLVREIATLAEALADAADDLLDRAESFLALLADDRNTLRSSIKGMVVDACVGLLANVPGYSALPSSARNQVRSSLGGAVDDVLDNRIFDDIEDVVEALAGEAAEFLAEVRDIDAGDDVAGAIVELLADSVEDALRDTFGNSVTIPIDFRAQGSYSGPRIDTPWGSYRPEISFDIRVDLGSVRIDIDDIVDVVRSVVDTLGLVRDAAEDFAGAVVAVLDLENRLGDMELEEENHHARENEARRRVSETRVSSASVSIVSPGAAAAYPGVVPVEIALTRVPRAFLAETEGEPARVHVFLNDAPLPLSRFSVEEGEAARDSIAGGLRGVHPIVKERMAQRVQLTGGKRAPQKTRGAATVVRKQAAPPPKATTRHGMASLAPAPRSATGKAQPGRAIRIGGKDVIKNGAVTLGRKPTGLMRGGIVLATFPELMLRGTLPLEDLRDGFNTLTVVVVNGTTESRVTESVAFLASEHARIRPSRGPFVKVRPGIPVASDVDPALLAPALRDAAVKRAARLARIGPPPPGAKRQSTVRLHPATKGPAEREVVLAREAIVAQVAARTRETRVLRDILRGRDKKGQFK